MPTNYPRRYRVESLVHEALSPIVYALHPDKLLTLRQVSLNRDLSLATVRYGTAANGDVGEMEEELNKLSGYCRRRLAAKLNMRATPKLLFVPDKEGLAADRLRDFLETIPPPAEEE